MGNGSGVSQGDRNRNARLARLRVLVPATFEWEAPEASNFSPQTLNGTSVRLNLLVAEPDAFAERAIANGAAEIAPIGDQSYGLR